MDENDSGKLKEIYNKVLKIIKEEKKDYSHGEFLNNNLELEELKTVKRKEIAEKIKIARDFGDLSENSEYDEAKNEQAQIEEKIVKLDNMIANAKIIDEVELDTKTVNVGATVTLVQVESKKKLEYTIVGSAESNPLEGKISNESPVGKAILGKKKGNKVQVQLPNGNVVEYKIQNIKRN